MNLKVRQRLLEYRPQYHIVPPTGGANDVQCIFWRGDYHVFYGLLPTFPLGSAKCWGHASSRDLVHWTYHPPCLEPDPGAAATWTGCLVDNDGVPTAFYTRVYPQAQCMATSRDLIKWHKYPGNPVIAAPPPEFGPGLSNFRDPCVWRESDGWYLALGSGIHGKGSAVLLYHSTNLTDWHYMHPLFVGPTYDADMYECPDFFPLGDRYVLLASTVIGGVGCTLYFVGHYQHHRFIPETEGRVDYGPCLYAAKTLCDDRRRRIMFGWVPESWSRDFRFLAGWSGAYSLPRVLSLDSKRRLGIAPAEELSALRQKHWGARALVLRAEEQRFLPDVQGRQIEIQVEIDPQQAKEVGLLVRASPAGAPVKEYTRLAYDPTRQRLILDCEHSSEFYPVNVTKNIREAEIRLLPGERLRLRVFVDASVVEVYANDRCCLTGCVYPFLPESDRVAVYAQGGAAVISQLDLWPLALDAGRKAPV